jgi:hypothetical protein
MSALISTLLVPKGARRPGAGPLAGRLLDQGPPALRRPRPAAGHRADARPDHEMRVFDTLMRTWPRARCACSATRTTTLTGPGKNSCCTSSCQSSPPVPAVPSRPHSTASCAGCATRSSGPTTGSSSYKWSPPAMIRPPQATLPSSNAPLRASECGSSTQPSPALSLDFSLQQANASAMSMSMSMSM